MAAPIVSWRLQDNTDVFPNWPIGTVDAGTLSSNVSFLVWNNYAGGVDVSDMQNCTITTKDDTGGNTGEVVLDRWVEVRVDSQSEVTFTPIGGDVTHPIQAGGSTGGATPNVPPHAGDGTSYDILGVANDGIKGNSLANFVEITAHANVPSTAGAGTTNFRLRVAYQYV